MTNNIWSAVRWWDEWQMRILISGSLAMQWFLLLAAPMRKYTIPGWLRRLIWLAYISYDALATLFNRQTKASNPCHVGVRASSLEVLWAPVILIHLGGREEITAYNIEDNEMWTRHTITLVSQVTVAVYAFYKTWPDSGDRRPPLCHRHPQLLREAVGAAPGQHQPPRLHLLLTGRGRAEEVGGVGGVPIRKAGHLGDRDEEDNADDTIDVGGCGRRRRRRAPSGLVVRPVGGRQGADDPLRHVPGRGGQGHEEARAGAAVGRPGRRRHPGRGPGHGAVHEALAAPRLRPHLR